jgi:hypothetical protein
MCYRARPPFAVARSALSKRARTMPM